jgi:hypothetical protein
MIGGGDRSTEGFYDEVSKGMIDARDLKSCTIAVMG